MKGTGVLPQVSKLVNGYAYQTETGSRYQINQGVIEILACSSVRENAEGPLSSDDVEICVG